MNKHASRYTRDDVCGLEERLLRFAASGKEGADIAREAASIICNQAIRLAQIGMALEVRSDPSGVLVAEK